MNEDPLALLPEILLMAGAVVTLLTGSFVPRERQWITRLTAVAALAAALTAGAVLAPGADRTVYDGTYALDDATGAARIIVPAASLIVLLLSVGRVRGDRRESEFNMLVLLAALGSILLAGTSDLLLLAVAYLLASIPLYTLAGWGRDAIGAEAALKLYLLGVLLGITMLLGITLLYALAGATDYAALTKGLPRASAGALAAGTVAVLAGLLFKAGAVPAHFWVPDAAAGATVPAAAFLTTVPKVGALIALYRLLTTIPEETVGWRLLIALLAAASMTLGNLAAFAQTDPLRLLGYSTISQVGYLMMAVAVANRLDALPSLGLYLAAYAVTNLGAFAAAAALPNLRTLRSYRGMGRQHPWLAGALTVCLLGLVGTPPTAVFAGKLTVFSATWSDGMAWLVVVAAVNTIASLFYYLRWIAPTVSAEGTHDAAFVGPPAEHWATTAAITSAGLTLALGIAAQLVLGTLSDPLTR